MTDPDTTSDPRHGLPIQPSQSSNNVEDGDRNFPISASDGNPRGDSTDLSTVVERPRSDSGPPAAEAKGKDKAIDADLLPTSKSHLTALPAELILSILSYLSPTDLTRVSETCHKLYTHATDDRLWKYHVQANVPGQRITSSYPCASFRELFGAHDPRWFVPRSKIWFADAGHLGRLVVARYDQRRGCIEGYYLLANNTNHSFHTWDAVPGTVISSFEPEVKLHLDKPAIQLPVKSQGTDVVHIFNPHQQGSDAMAEESGQGSSSSQERRVFESEVLMQLSPLNRLRSSFLYAQRLPDEDAAERSNSVFPYYNIWPPPAVPAPHRVLGAGVERRMTLRAQDRANSRRDVYDRAFRIRNWFEGSPAEWYPAIPHRALALLPALIPANPESLFQRPSVGEEISTYATLDPAVYTPTPTKPFRGIWVGDYSSHGCEFLWLHQPDDDPDEPPFDPEESVVRLEGESDEAYAARKRDAVVYRGRLEAVKLTGDANVPRGECSWVVDDLGEGGFVEVARGAPFEGVRVVKSRGHVAHSGFADDSYTEAQLMLISPDRLAHNWITLQHVSYFQRVDIDRFLVPE